MSSSISFFCEKGRECGIYCCCVISYCDVYILISDVLGKHTVCIALELYYTRSFPVATQFLSVVCS